jgi:hypothetical protein
MNARTDRRAPNDRRRRAEPQEPLERQTQRRREDRRESWRAWRKATLIEWPDGVLTPVLAELSLEGARFTAPSVVISSDVELRLRAAGKRELRLPGRVQRMQRASGGTAVHVRFDELDVRTSLALARVLEEEHRA